MHLVSLEYCRLGKHLLWCADAQNPALMQQYEFIAVPRRQIEIMKRSHGGEPIMG